MSTGEINPEDLTQDLMLTMQQLEPLLRSMLALLQATDRSTESQIEALSALLDRIATGLETTTGHLENIGPRMQAQEAALTTLSGQVSALGQRLDQQNQVEAGLQDSVAELLALLRG